MLILIIIQNTPCSLSASARLRRSFCSWRPRSAFSSLPALPDSLLLSYPSYASLSFLAISAAFLGFLLYIFFPFSFFNLGHTAALPMTLLGPLMRLPSPAWIKDNLVADPKILVDFGMLSPPGELTLILAFRTFHSYRRAFLFVSYNRLFSFLSRDLEPCL